MTGINMFKKAFPSLNPEFSVNISISLWLLFQCAVREVLGLQVQFGPRARWLQADNEQQVVDGSTGSAGCSGGPAVVAQGGGSWSRCVVFITCELTTLWKRTSRIDTKAQSYFYRATLQLSPSRKWRKRAWLMARRSVSMDTVLWGHTAASV